MISQDRDYEEILRDALRAAAESIEPAGDGLERIHHRSRSPRSARSMLAGAADWLQLYRIRLSVRLESFRWELNQRGIGQPPAGPGHNGPTPAGKTAGRLGPAAAWLKPAFAVVAVVAVVVVGVFTLDRMREAVITPTDSVTSPGQQHAPSAGTGRPSPGLWQPPIGVKPSPSPTSKKKRVTTVLPAIASTPTPSPSRPGPTASSSATPTPTPTGSAAASPTPTPGGTGSPSGTPTTGSGGSTATGSGASTATGSGGSTATGSGIGTATGSGASTANATADVMFASGTGGGPSEVTCGNTTTPKTTRTTS